MPERISAIASIDEKRGLGRDNQMAWHIKADLVHFKELTQERVVIIGSNTFDSMEYYYNKSGRPMPAKKYLVLTSDLERATKRENVSFVHSLDEALKLAGQIEDQEIFIAGGAFVYKETIGIVDRIYLTVVDGDFKCDAFFPDYSNFTEVASIENEENGIKFYFKILERKQN